MSSILRAPIETISSCILVNSLSISKKSEEIASSGEAGSTWNQLTLASNNQYQTANCTKQAAINISIKLLILDCSGWSYIDATALKALAQVILIIIKKLHCTRT